MLAELDRASGRAYEGNVPTSATRDGSLAGLDPSDDESYRGRISALLRQEVMTFDREIGEAVKRICPNPRGVKESKARGLVAQHREILGRAYYGTTLTIALINRTENDMWVAGVGDSTVGQYEQIQFVGLPSPR
jgi:hypothetical protein